ncbi:hypothetical protein CPT_Phriendly_010 [Vibrio phage Phriendly]|nr:hypothetical protein CPT_Phriendly_010 [Vibrio phage Phriendly]
MNINDVVINNQYIIVRHGLVNTGRVGRALRTEGNKVVLRMNHNNKDLTLNAMSIEPHQVQQPAPAPPAPQAAQPVANELVKPKEKKAVKKQKVKVLDVPPRDSWLILKSKDGTSVSLHNNRDFVFDDNRVLARWTDNDLTDRYVGWFDKNTALIANKPQDIMEYPFWDEFLMGERYHFSPRRIGMQHKAHYVEDINGLLVNAKWIDTANINKHKEIEIDVDVDGKEVLPELEEQIRLAMQKDAQAATGLSFAVYYTKKGTGKLIHKRRDNAACHYHMRCFVDNKLAEKIDMQCAAQFITDNYFGDIKKEEVYRYLSWVMNDSPWARYCVTKDIEEAKTGGIRVRTDIPANAMMCTFYALRYPTEYCHVVRSWCKYTNEGLDGTVAFYKAETRDYERDTASHHGLLDTFSMTLKCLEAFVNNEVGGTVTKDYDKWFNYDIVSRHHGKRNRQDRTALNEITDMFKPKKIKEKHPVLGTVEKVIPAAEQIDEFLTKMIKVK